MARGPALTRGSHFSGTEGTSAPCCQCPVLLVPLLRDRSLLTAPVHPPASSPSHSHRRLALRVEVGASADTLRSIATLVHSSGCRGIHYAGHADADHLVLESASATGCGRAHKLSGAKLRDLFAAGRRDSLGRQHGGSVLASPPPPLAERAAVRSRSGVRFCFVSACQSQAAGEAFVAAGVPHVVAVKTWSRVADQAAHHFTSHFYLALFNGSTVQQAFDIGKAFLLSLSDDGFGGGGGGAGGGGGGAQAEPRGRVDHPVGLVRE